MWNIKSQALLLLAFASQTLGLGATVSLAPQITNFTCNARDAVISWKPHTDGAEVESYKIEYSTSYEPNNWTVAEEKKSTESSTTIEMVPGVNYTFRVVSVGKDNISHPSEPSEICSSEADIPYRNPDDAKIISLGPLEMTIKWTPIPQMEHNGPDFHYIVEKRPRDNPFESQTSYIRDWKQNTFVLKCDSFKLYDFEVRSANKIGPSKVPTTVHFAYPGEGRPNQAPRKFKVLLDTDNVNSDGAIVTFQWEPVPVKALNGRSNRMRYLIQFWSQDNPEHIKGISYEYINLTNLTYISESYTGAEFNFDSVYFAQIRATTDRFLGPTSQIIEFRTPESVPGKVGSFGAVTMGSSAILLKWTKPYKPNGQLIGYNIYYEIEGSVSHEREPQITSPNVTEAILGGLEPNSTYRFHIAAVTKSGEGKEYVELIFLPRPNDKSDVGQCARWR